MNKTLKEIDFVATPHIFVILTLFLHSYIEHCEMVLKNMYKRVEIVVLDSCCQVNALSPKIHSTLKSEK